MEIARIILATVLATFAFTVLFGGFINADNDEKSVIFVTALFTSFIIVMIILIFNLMK